MNPSPKTLLVTGGAGFIGSHFVKQRVSLGDKVFVLDALTYAGNPETLKGVAYEDLIIDTICNTSLVLELLQKHKVDALVHFAAESHVDRSISSPSVFIETNIQGTFSLLNASLHYWQTLKDTEKRSFRYLQVSTDEVFGSLGATGFFNEKTPYSPNSPYSASKAAADHLVRAWFHTYRLPTLTTNCSNNYGPYQYPEKLIPHIIHCALTEKPLPIYGKGTNIRDWIHVEDHCRGISLALEKGIKGETYCFGGNTELSNLEIVHKICENLDLLHPKKNRQSYKTTLSFVPDRLGHDARYGIDSTRAQKELGFTRYFEFEKGLTETIKWYLDNQSWCKKVLKKRK